jgi:hypothetical protein
MGGGDETIRLDYARPDRPWWRAVGWWHWALLGLWAVVFMGGVILLFNPIVTQIDALGVGIYGTPAAPIMDLTRDGDEARYKWQAAGYLAVFLLTQWLFLLPRGSWRIRLMDEPRPMKWAIILAGLIAMLISVGLLATVLDLGGHWERLAGLDRGEGHDYRIVWLIMLSVWAFWGVLFWRYGRSLDRYTFFSRIVRLLVAASVLETLVAGAVYAWTDRDNECYCARGSYTGLVFGLTAIIWLFGPGIVLLWWREKRRRERLAV